MTYLLFDFLYGSIIILILFFEPHYRPKARQIEKYFISMLGGNFYINLFRNNCNHRIIMQLYNNTNIPVPVNSFAFAIPHSMTYLKLKNC